MPGASAGEGETLGLPEGAVLRGRRPGDVVRPAGMAGRKKLQDYYVDRKVPRRERDAAPVIALGGEVFWTPFGPAQAGASGRPFTVRAQRAGACRALTS
jgi:tRNA(Ile)-lysidine synthetase-like protein